MSKQIEIKVPDIGTTAEVDVIEVFVKTGDEIHQEDPLITIEGEKASMEVPSPKSGKVREVKVNVGDKIAEGNVILILEQENQEIQEDNTQNKETALTSKEENKIESPSIQTAKDEKNTPAMQQEMISIPDIGTAATVDVIEVHVKPGEQLAVDAPMITLEGEKASMELPAPKAGKVVEVRVKPGDKVKQGDAILKIETKGEKSVAAAGKEPSGEKETSIQKTLPQSAPAPLPATSSQADFSEIYAGPATRQLARELGVDLNQVTGTGRKGRITLLDVHNFVKQTLQQGAGMQIAKAPQIDFSKFGDIETVALSKIKRFTGQNTHRSWITVPHVTQFDEADITELEAFRQKNKSAAEKNGYKLTPLVFIMKAVTAALKKFPDFNASLNEHGEGLILKKYFHIGVAVDTPNGLVVPVIRDVDKKSLSDLAKELAEISTKARTKGLSITEMQGGCFTISSLGGIGGTAFTPIVNHPEVAILGVSRSQHKPVYQNGQFVPRLMLPLSLSYDHRVIDGAQAAHFTSYLAEMIGDIRNLLL